MKSYLALKLFNKRGLTLLMVFVIAFAVRFMYISRGTFQQGTLELVTCAHKTLATSILHYSNGAGSPLTILIASLFVFLFKLFGAPDPVMGVNFMSVFFGSLNVILLFLLAEKLFGIRAAVISATFFSFFGPLVAFSTFGNSFILSMCFYLASLLCMVKYVSGSASSYFVFSSLFFGFSVAAQLSSCLVIFPLSFLFFYSFKLNSKSFRMFSFYFGLAFISGGIFYHSLFFEKGVRAIRELFQDAGFINSLIPLKSSGWMQLVDIFTPEGLILACVGLCYLILGNRIKDFIFLILWFLSLQIFCSMSTRAARFVAIAWLPLILAQGSFLGKIKGKMFILSCMIAIVLTVNGYLRFSDSLELGHKYALESDFVKPGDFVWGKAK